MYFTCRHPVALMAMQGLSSLSYLFLVYWKAFVFVLNGFRDANPSDASQQKK